MSRQVKEEIGFKYVVKGLEEVVSVLNEIVYKNQVKSGKIRDQIDELNVQKLDLEKEGAAAKKLAEEIDQSCKNSDF